MARDKNRPIIKVGCAEWLATYGDLVTLVLTFFVLLFSFSTMDVEKWKMAASSLSGMPGIFEGTDFNISPGEAPYLPPGITELDVEDLETLAESDDEWEAIANIIKNILGSEELPGSAIIEHDSTQIKLILEGDVLFDSGSAVLKPDSAAILVEVMQQIIEREDIPLPLIGTFRIEGHTDTNPINTGRYPNNWYLSSDRALSVREYLEKNFPASEFPITPDMYSAEGRGEYHPRDTNDTPEGRARNRRVEFIIVRESQGNIFNDAQAEPAIEDQLIPLTEDETVPADDTLVDGTPVG